MTTIRDLRIAGLGGAAVLLAAFSAPGTASSTAGQTNATAQTNQQVSVTARRSDRDVSERQICIRDSFSGSRMVRTICKTAQEWETAGGIPGSER